MNFVDEKRIEDTKKAEMIENEIDSFLNTIEEKQREVKALLEKLYELIESRKEI